MISMENDNKAILERLILVEKILLNLTRLVIEQPSVDEQSRQKLLQCLDDRASRRD